MAIDVQIINGQLVITADLAQVRDGDTSRILASTRGNVNTGVLHPATGKAIVLALNVYVDK